MPPRCPCTVSSMVHKISESLVRSIDRVVTVSKTKEGSNWQFESGPPRPFRVTVLLLLPHHWTMNVTKFQTLLISLSLQFILLAQHQPKRYNECTTCRCNNWGGGDIQYSRGILLTSFAQTFRQAREAERHLRPDWTSLFGQECTV